MISGIFPHSAEKSTHQKRQLKLAISTSSRSLIIVHEISCSWCVELYFNDQNHHYQQIIYCDREKQLSIARLSSWSRGNLIVHRIRRSFRHFMYSFNWIRLKVYNNMKHRGHSFGITSYWPDNHLVHRQILPVGIQ